MKKIKALFFVLSFLMTVAITLSACSFNYTRYNLIEINVGGLTLEHYYYNYIEFNYDNNTYKIENKTKLNNVVTKQTGNFFVDKDNKVLFTNDDIPSQNYIMYPNENAFFQDDKFHVEAYIEGYGYINMIYKK